MRWSESTPIQIVTYTEIEGGGYRNIYFLNYDDIGFNLIGYNRQNGDTSENHLYVFTYKNDGLKIDFYVEEGKISRIRLHRTDIFDRAVKETEDS